jgi:hypothetical protein
VLDIAEDLAGLIYDISPPETIFGMWISTRRRVFRGQAMRKRKLSSTARRWKRGRHAWEKIPAQHTEKS